LLLVQAELYAGSLISFPLVGLDGERTYFRQVPFGEDTPRC
jgi:hypothetical protein